MPSSDEFHSRAAEGWLQLGNPNEARREFDRLSENYRKLCPTLELLWTICAEAKDWKEALKASRKLGRTDPTNPEAFVHQAYALHELKRTSEAREVLLKVVKYFPSLPTIPYNLACYACQLDDLAEARKWLQKAINIAGKNEIKAMAKDDPDLEPLREEIFRS